MIGRFVSAEAQCSAAESKMSIDKCEWHHAGCMEKRMSCMQPAWLEGVW